jgi:hypothetical protein
MGLCSKSCFALLVSRSNQSCDVALSVYRENPIFRSSRRENDVENEPYAFCANTVSSGVKKGGSRRPQFASSTPDCCRAWYEQGTERLRMPTTLSSEKTRLEGRQSSGPFLPNPPPNSTPFRRPCRSTVATGSPSCSRMTTSPPPKHLTEKGMGENTLPHADLRRWLSASLGADG